MRSPTDLSTSPPTTYTHTHTHTGIGGAGNIRRAPPPTSLTQHSHPTTNTPHQARLPSSSSSSRFSTGRGGAGNMPPPGLYRAMFALDEDTQLQQRRVRPAPVTYHTGRGGEGNRVYAERGRRASIESGESGSASSGDAEAKAERESQRGRREREGKRGSLEVAKEWLRRW